MKYLFFISSLGPGGAERISVSLSNEFILAGHQVTIVSQQSTGFDFYPINTNVCRINMNTTKVSFGVLMALQNNLIRIYFLRRIIKIQKPNIVISMISQSNILALLATIGMQVPVVVCERSYPPSFPINRSWDFLRRWTYPLASKVVMLTSEGLDWLNREIPRAHGVVIPNPTIYPLPIGAPELIPAGLVSADRKILLAVGRMTEEKGFVWLIEAFASLARQHQQWDLIILGDGPLRALLMQQIQMADLVGRVFMPGQAGNMGAWYERADLYVLSSRVEGFPNSLSEAMAYGCAAVSFDCDTGPRDLIRHEVDGLLVPTAKILDLIQSLGRLMQDDALRLLFAERAIEIRNRYSMKKIKGLWENLSNEVLR